MIQDKAQDKSRDERLIGFLNLIMADKDISEEELNTVYDNCIRIVFPIIQSMKPEVGEEKVREIIKRDLNAVIKRISNMEAGILAHKICHPEEE